MKNQAKIVGFLPKNSKVLILNRIDNGDRKPYRYEGILLDNLDLEGLCGVRGSLIITLEDVDKEKLEYEVKPLLCSSIPVKKLQDHQKNGTMDKYIEERGEFRNDYITE